MQVICTNDTNCGWAGEAEHFICPVCLSLALPRSESGIADPDQPRPLRREVEDEDDSEDD